MEIHQSSSGGGGITEVTATLPLTSSGGDTPDISSTLIQNRLLGRGSVSGTGVFQTITLGTNISLTGTTLNVPTGAGISTPISLANGGTALSNASTVFTTSGAINALAVPTTLLIYKGVGISTINGMVAQADGVRVTIVNATTSNSVFITHQSSSATAVNRFINPAGGVGNFVVMAGTASEWEYDGTTQRWRCVGGYPYSSSANDGVVSSTQVNSWDAKVDGSGAVGQVALFFDTDEIGGQNNLSYDTATSRLGVQTGIGNEEGSLHVANTVGDSISGLGSYTATLTLFTTISNPTGGSATQTAGHLYAANSFSLGLSANTTPYLAGDSVDYRVRAYNTDSGTIYSVVYAANNITIGTGSGSDGDSVNLSWSDNMTGTEGIDGYIVERQINGGGFNNWADLGYTNSASDDYFSVGGIGWNGGSFSPSPSYPDFIATSQNFNYDAYGKEDFGGTPVFSPGNFNYGFTDDGSGNPYVIFHSIIASSSSARVIKDSASFKDGLSFTEDSISFVGGTTVTPTSYGNVADGSFWNQSFDAYNKQTSPLLYSVAGINQTLTDPNDSQVYYAVHTFSGQVSAAKILKSGAGSETLTVSPFYSEGAGFAGDTVITPTAIYPVTVIVEQAVDREGIKLLEDTNQKASMHIRGSGDALRAYINYDNSSGTGYLLIGKGSSLQQSSKPWMIFDQNEHYIINAGGEFRIQQNGTLKFTLTSTGVDLVNKITKYNNITTVSNGVPSELATADLTGQTAAKAATTLYTPTASGMFRISIVLQVTTAGTTSVLGGGTGVTITYTEPDGSVAQTIKPLLVDQAGAVVVPAAGNAGNTTATQSQGSCIINAKTGVAIQYAIGYTSTGTAMQYAAHLKVEAM